MYLTKPVKQSKENINNIDLLENDSSISPVYSNPTITAAIDTPSLRVTPIAPETVV